MVNTFGSNCPHKPLADGVGLRRLRRRLHAGNAQRGQPLVKIATVIAVPVVDQEFRLPAERRGLQHLAPNPGGGGAGGDVDMHPFASIMAEREEDLGDAVADGLDHEEVGGPDAAQLVAQEGPPVLVIVARTESPPAVAPDGAVADDKAEFQQFAPDALAAPKRILLGDAGDQLSRLGIKARSAQSGVRLLGPIQAPTLQCQRITVSGRTMGGAAANHRARRAAATPTGLDREAAVEDAVWSARQPEAGAGEPSSPASTCDGT